MSIPLPPRCLWLLTIFGLPLLALAQAARTTPSEWEEVRRSAYVAGMMERVAEDPRIFLRVQEAVVEYHEGLTNPSSRLDRSRPRLSDYAYYGGRKIWDVWTAEETDAALDTGSSLRNTGQLPRSVGKTVSYIQAVKSASILSEKLYDRWTKAEALALVANRGKDVEVILAEAYDIGVAEAARARRTIGAPVPLFNARLADTSDRYGKIPQPTDSEEVLLTAAPQGHAAKTLLVELRKLSAEQRQQLATSREALQRFIDDRLGGQKKLTELMQQDISALTDGVGILVQNAEREARSAASAARREAYESRWREAHGGLRIVVSLSALGDPQSAQLIDVGGTALLTISKAASDISRDGLTAAATGNFLSAAVSIAGLFKKQKADPFAKYVAEQFEALRRQLNVIIEQLVLQDRRLVILQESQDAGFGITLAKLDALSADLATLSLALSVGELQRLLGDAIASYNRCRDHSMNSTFDLAQPEGRARYHDCLDHAMNIAVTRASQAAQTGQVTAQAIDDLGIVRPELASLDFISRPNDFVSLVRFASNFQTGVQKLEQRQHLRETSAGFRQRAIPGADSFNPGAWEIGLRSIVDLRLAFSGYEPAPASPSASYLKTLAEMGHWLYEEISFISSDASIVSAAEAFRVSARTAAEKTEELVSSGLRHKYGAFLYDKNNKVKGPRSDYFDLPTNVFLGFDRDAGWRDTGFDINRPKDAAFLASALNLLEEEVGQHKSVGSHRVRGTGERHCYTTTRRLFIRGRKADTQATIGTQAYENCGVTAGGMPVISIAGLNTYNLTAAKHYRERWFLNSELPFDATTVPQSAEDPTPREALVETYPIEGHRLLLPELRRAIDREAREVIRSYFSADPSAAAQRRAVFFEAVFKPVNRAGAAVLVGLAAKWGTCVVGSANARQLLSWTFDQGVRGPSDVFFDGQKTIDRTFLLRGLLSDRPEVQRVSPPERPGNAPAAQVALTSLRGGAVQPKLLVDASAELGRSGARCRSDSAPALTSGLGHLAIWDSWNAIATKR